MADEQPKADNFRLVKKMSSKTVYGSRLDIAQLCLTDRSKPHSLFDVIGIARGVKRGASQMGEWIAFIGEFHAKSYMPIYDGITFHSGRLFLGGPAGDLLLGQMRAFDDNEVEFAFTIQAQADEASATGYTYTAVPLVKPGINNPIERLKARLTGGQFSTNTPALAGPQTDRAAQLAAGAKPGEKAPR